MLIEENMIFNDHTINIFTDASITRESNKSFTGCPGFVTYTGPNNDSSNYNLITTNILSNTTNNQSEVYAIMMAIDYIVQRKDQLQGFNINIFSDSKISVFGLRNWIVNWAKGSVNHIMYSSTGEPVKNQWIFINCVRMILENNLRLKIYHVHGHMNANNQSQVYTFKQDFDKFNDIDGNSISYNLAKKLIFCNDVIDRYTRDQLDKRFELDRIDLKNNLMKPVMTENISIDNYLNLIGERKFN